MTRGDSCGEHNVIYVVVFEHKDVANPFDSECLIVLHDVQSQHFSLEIPVLKTDPSWIRIILSYHSGWYCAIIQPNTSQ